MAEIDKEKVIAVLNQILERELAGVVRYTHYSFLVFGFGRIPLVSWLRDQATEALAHAQQAGEWITTLGAYPWGVARFCSSRQRKFRLSPRDGKRRRRREAETPPLWGEPGAPVRAGIGKDALATPKPTDAPRHRPLSAAAL